MTRQSYDHHEPVMVAEVLALMPDNPHLAADLTLGCGGHTEAILRTKREVEVIAFDRDVGTIEIARKRLARYSERLTFVNQSYAQFESAVDPAYHQQFDFILADLGLSSWHLSHSGRGFSFAALADPLDLRFDNRSGKPLSELLKTVTKAELSKILAKFGELRNAGRVAAGILSARDKGLVNNVGDLVAAVSRYSRPDRRNRFLSQCWQALRIWTNSELEHLGRGLREVVPFMKPGGVICIISFHSLEDRITRDFFTQEENPCICPPNLPVCGCGRKARLTRISRRPLKPTEAEISRNPQARSARLRAARKSQVN